MPVWVTLLLDYLKRWRAHAGKAKAAWIAIGVPIAVALAMWPVWRLLSLNTEQYARYVGGLLELAGICTVALGLRDTRSLFERPSFRKTIGNWFRSIPRWREQHSVHVGTGIMTLQPMAAQAYGTVTAPPNATTEQRISALESEVKNLSGRIQATRTEIDERIAEQKNALAAEQRERQEQVEGTRKLIDEAVAGGLVFEAMGLVWLVLGLLLATSSSELAKLF